MMWQILLGPLAQPGLASMFQVVAENPAVAAARSNLGVALKASGRLEEAEAQLLLAVQLDSTYARGYNNLGNAQHDCGEYEGAVASYDKALALARGRSSGYNLDGGAAASEKGKSELREGEGAAGQRSQKTAVVAAAAVAAAAASASELHQVLEQAGANRAAALQAQAQQQA